MDRDAAQAWLSEPQFIADFSAALDVYRESLETPVEKAE
jgi:hypothetical protein